MRRSYPSALLALLLAIFSPSILPAQTPDQCATLAYKALDAKEYATALNYAEKALKADAKHLNSLLIKGYVLEHMKKFQQAYNVYTQALDWYPDQGIAYNHRGTLLTSISQPEAAIEDFTVGLRTGAPDSVKLMLYMNRGTAYAHIRQFDNAYADNMRALALDSNNVSVLNNIAAVCDEVGRGKETLGYLYRVVKLDSNFVGGYGNIGFKLQQDGRFEESLQWFNKVIGMSGDDPLGYSNRAFSYLKLNRLEEALTDVNRSIKLYPDNAYAFKVRALVQFGRGNSRQGCADLKEALRLGFTKMYGEEVNELLSEKCK